eukprot:CAMPEP_0198364584 /NCGR_PEP_ID=MMETSP1450-20131203/153739_1 /TAXON_ID=753684 ORGANISM="Madagascaria erythrocladiodes, Strain CCMP3234" /NCGR_SAMPLE_ID=MMETSP1450 /ASSEMBLY_ACC=CAM_ASM_001115 /LENGTH=1082 /DNA_ID=CAMNT_0044072023 /DNA_START=157 /DNA_END=3405 /DNA_ORIENTATION=-
MAGAAGAHGGGYIEDVEQFGVPDFVLMDAVSEDAMFANMVKRFKHDRIYTYIGDVCVAVNPFRKIDVLADPERRKNYFGRYNYENPPHIWSTADDTYRSLLKNKQNQCVIISGESGAGKTESSKIVMRYIAAASPTSKAQDMERIKDQLLDSNPILEAFGNAKTLRNDNSSRFGKYMEVQFNQAGAPLGGIVTSYLLEKSRVVTRADGERSFHIFYQLLASGDAALLQSLELSADPSAYTYLSQSSCYTVTTMDDAAEFRVVRAAFKVLQFDDGIQQSMFRVLAAILHLGNVVYSAAGDKAKIDDAAPIAAAARLLACDEAKLRGALLSRTVSAGGQHINTPLKLAQAQYARDALCKTIYEKVFRTVVRRINAVLKNDKLGKEELTIGLLDIYGFEVFEHNSFEQFCINLVNEKLQQVFIELTLKREQEEYVREEIEWVPVDYFNNRIICELIEHKKNGIIAYLDECCTLSNLTDRDFLRRLDDNFQSHAHYESYAASRDKTIGETEFRLKHYAGDVLYDVDGMIDKNKDELFRDLVAAVHTSQDAHIKELFPPLTDSKKRPETAGSQFRRAVSELIDALLLCEPHYIRCVKPNDNKKPAVIDEERVRHQIRYLGLVENVRVRLFTKVVDQKKRPLTAGTQFKIALAKLVDSLMMCEPNYIRCIKPNEQKRQLYAEEERFRHQIRYLGLVENVRVRRAGFAFRMEYERFFRRYKMLAPQCWPEWRGGARDGTAALVAALQIPAAKHQMGKTKLFLKDPQSLFAFEEARNRALPALVARMQGVYRGWKVRSQWRQRRAAIVLQLVWKTYRARAYVAELAQTFGNAAQLPDYGANTQFPRPPMVLANAHQKTTRVHQTWRAHMVVGALSPGDQGVLRQKVLTYTLFNGRKAWDCARQHLGDYLESAANPRSPQYKQAMAQLFAKYGDTSVAFSDNCVKVNPKGKAQLRAITVTERNLYKQNPKNYKVLKVGTSLADVTGISLSTLNDRFVVVHCKAPVRDLLLDLGESGEERASEFVTVLVKNIQMITGNSIAPAFNNTVSYNNTRTDKADTQPRQLSFVANAAVPKPVFKKQGAADTIQVGGV